MEEKRKKREKQIEAIFKVYNGSAVVYRAPKISSKSVAQICSTGSRIAKGTSINELIDEARQ